MKKINLLLVMGVCSMLFITSCKKDDPIIENEEELITTLIYTLTPEAGGAPVVLSFQDLDGVDGTIAPIFTGGTLAANTSYNGSLQLLNESVNPAEDITVEVQEEAEDHQFFFQNNISGLSIAYTDEDENGHPIGLSSKISTTGSGSGTITVTLRHEPNKTAAGVSTGDITNAGGETDIEVTFDVEIQ
jgi:hypothetical protein